MPSIKAAFPPLSFTVITHGSQGCIAWLAVFLLHTEHGELRGEKEGGKNTGREGKLNNAGAGKGENAGAEKRRDEFKVSAVGWREGSKDRSKGG